MRINAAANSALPNLYSASATPDSPKMETGNLSPFLRHDTVELSQVVARELPNGVIEHKAAKMYFNEEIKASLDKVLAGKSPEVGEAVDRLIESNLFAANVDYSSEERSALLEAGLTQAKFLADHYMQPEEASEFLDTIHLLAAVATTREVDAETGNVSYVELPRKPLGAPAEYVNAGDLMQRYDPEAFSKWKEAIANGGNAGGILIQFAKKLQKNPDWAKEYREDQDKVMKDLRSTRIDNRFDSVNVNTVDDFASAMRERIAQSALSNKDLILNNTLAFARTLGI
ncbi:hypothetical protein [Cohnella cholangitidis]|uniref:Uncharacterized protein n=1 Tax=Cohnella cholangitidis TaxID=2598458 RepID=A0A7G5C0E9_9BACL|nr:hypothetical protein [Cohnella cholangitidis]QMV42683.1 hypothetical protein FPL14_16920 [Cohnella cholangitidis]